MSKTLEEFDQLFRERFGRKYDMDQPVFSLSEEEFELVSEFLFACDNVVYQFTYKDPVTQLTYEVFYKFDVDHDRAIVAYALLGKRKVRLTRALRQRMLEAAFQDFQDWLKEWDLEDLEDRAAVESAFDC